MFCHFSDKDDSLKNLCLGPPKMTFTFILLVLVGCVCHRNGSNYEFLKVNNYCLLCCEHFRFVFHNIIVQRPTRVILHESAGFKQNCCHLFRKFLLFSLFRSENPGLHGCLPCTQFPALHAVLLELPWAPV